jgi:hypothetical protein
MELLLKLTKLLLADLLLADLLLAELLLADLLLADLLLAYMLLADLLHNGTVTPLNFYIPFVILQRFLKNCTKLKLKKLHFWSIKNNVIISI